MARLQNTKHFHWVPRLLIFAAGIGVGTFFSVLLTRPSASAIAKNSSPPAAKRKAVPTKPWGVLETLKIPLAEEENLFPDREQRLRPPCWFFENFSQSDVTAFLASCDLGGAHDFNLTAPNYLQVLSNGCLVLPPAELVRTLDSATRSRIYAVLARSGYNYAQKFPFRFTPEKFSSYFEAPDFAQEKINLLRGLTYTNGTDLCLTDLELLPNLLATNEFDHVVECLYRVPTYRIRLRVYPDSNIESLISYWGKGSRATRVRPLLQSLAKTSGEDGATLNIGFFLPQFARLRLYTFPDAWNEAQSSKEDCFWTSMNFFKDRPDPRFLDPAEVRKSLQTDYELVHEQPVFGDLVTLINSSGDAIHMCVYIADDFVFTKNGKTQLAPWVLMKIPDMLLLFPSEAGRRMVVFRSKEPAGNIGAGSIAKAKFSRDPS